MSVFSKIYRLRSLLTAALLLPLLCACSFYDYSDGTDADPSSLVERYINLSIVVSSGNEGATRADEKPAGGEDGDGREAGLKRENKVTGITLMLYRDDAGINTTDEETVIDFIRYYPVHEIENKGGDIEASYTTDNQPLATTDIKMGVEYHAIVVANKNLTGKVNKGDKVKKVRDEVINDIYEGDGIGINAENFVMSSEKDFEFILSNPKDETINGKSALVYSVDGIRIERFAARIDFCTDKNYVNPEVDGYYPGYRYPVVDENRNPNGDFVVTAITPFNFYNSDEYLIKRVGDNSDVSYLADESNNYNSTTTSYVVDPNTFQKTNEDYTGDNVPKYNYKLEGLIGKSLGEINKSGSSFQVLTIQSVENESNQLIQQSDGSKIIIVGYPKENTLPVGAELYRYATGLRIEGDYYKAGFESSANPDDHLVYYGFLRHEGEKVDGSYNAYTEEDLKQKMETDELKQKFPMNFGIVRNNIYRVSIDKIVRDKDSKTTLKIKVKKWDKFTHDTIYM